MGWIIAATVLLVLLHRALEEAVCSGPTASRRRLFWNIGTAIFVGLSALVAFIVVFSNIAWRQEWGWLVSISLPVALIGSGIFAHLAWVAYDLGQFDSTPATDGSSSLPPSDQP